jgi:hypothetical protein
MKKPPPLARRSIRVGRLDLDLRGIAPDTAEATARALGPALARALTQGAGVGIRDWRFGPADRVDAGRIDSAASPDAHDLAARLAQRIALALGGEEP